MFCWHLLAAFILLSVEDFYQISANEFIDSIVVTLGKVDVRLHINHSENRQKKSVPFDKSQHWSLARPYGNSSLLLFWPFNMIVQPCSQRAKTTSCGSHVSHYFKYEHKHKTWKAWLILHTLLCLYIMKFDHKMFCFVFFILFSFCLISTFLSSSVFADTSDRLL